MSCSQWGDQESPGTASCTSEGTIGPLHSTFVLSPHLLCQLEGRTAAAAAVGGSREGSVRGCSLRGSLAGSSGGDSTLGGPGAVTEVLRGYASGYVDGHCQALAAAHPGQVRERFGSMFCLDVH
jgi:hypothetical protein